METDANIADLTTVSFADFETKNREENASYNMGMTIDLSLGHKEENMFATDQTPTPTRLIKNCDEVGLFEDLQHVNPFDIGFQRAAEQNAVGGHAIPMTPTRSEVPTTEGDSLHTPQVYPLDSATVSAAPPPVSNSSSPLDVAVPNVEDLLKTPTLTPVPSTVAVPTTTESGPPPLQLIQPQVITWVLPAQTYALTTVPASNAKQSKSAPSTQKVRPLLLPKPSKSVNSKAAASVTTPTPTTSVHEPSSASLTPTSQLPIKERLKAILNNSYNKKQRSFEAPAPKVMSAVNRNEDTMIRRRAAASRYRHKMRMEHKDIKEHNELLQKEILVLRKRIATLERELQLKNNNNIAGVVTNQIQMPPSSIHLVINVPKMIVPSSESSQSLDKQ